ncbi:restriction endonuclease subunit S [Vibrio gallaecicus]|uniref:restriction endonuclease subunit S n=1 Tax=Vibrio gallaecicus TaxID=552386 RepID=UPI0010C9E106|nr:restriction endonuclease subunit S [Vibrio gallaecicus]MDN3614680.1 restriction endonuclease subunit S [Vibrio gallaecicus]MDN3615717.1 restriction endonuclease subunit S [Vibrio gallaecicus]MDN3615756.1 restriction endonuclease subunit S [Vibrio gallaecicus]MDN3615870.1 restriction endonuclease subunit S [Vibrio gallaecicus]
MSKLTKHRFSDLYSMSSGISSTKEQAGHGAPFLSFSAVFNNYFVPDELEDLMDASAKQQETYSIKKGDIFLTRTSEVVDELAMSSVATQDYPNATYSGFLKRLRPTQSDISYSKFMAFYLRSSLFRKTMTNNAVMTLRASLNEDIFSYLELWLPDYEEQVKIGDFLYNLSRKIDTNNKINSELEAMTKALYDYWFVQFDFPDSNGNPYKSSGGKMVYCNDTKREIPEGWFTRSLVDEMDVQYGYPFSTKQFNEKKLGAPVARIRNILDNSISMYSTENVDDKYLIEKGDLLVGMDGNFHINFWSKNGCYLNQRCFRVRKKTESTISLFQAYYQIQPYIKAREKNVSRTTVGHLSADDVNGLNVLISNSSAVNEKMDFFDSLLEQIMVRRNENSELLELIDNLVPIFMNGQATVK